MVGPHSSRQRRSIVTLLCASVSVILWIVPASSGPETQLLSTGPVVVVNDAGNIGTQFDPPDVRRGGVISDVNVRVRIDHPQDDEVDLFLFYSGYPLGGGPSELIELELSSDNGGTGANYGSGTTDCSGTMTTFDDEAAVAVTAGTAPFAGSFRPEEPLSTLDGRTSTGRWTLVISDDEIPPSSGTVFCFEVEIVTEFCPKVRKRSGTHVVGGPGTQKLRGTDYRDVVCGLGGKDKLIGLGWSDLLLGGPGPDFLKGGRGNDTCVGGPGRDRFSGCEKRVQ